MLTLEEYISTYAPKVIKRYEVYQAAQNPDSLIGRKVESVVSGFGSFGGTKMIIDSIGGNYVSFIAAPDALEHHKNGKWGCPLDELHTHVEFI